MFKANIAGRSLLFILALFLTAFAGCGGGGGSSASQIFTPTTYTLSGTITSGGVGLSGVTVTLTGATNQSTTTGATGSYTFSGLSNGNYVVTPSKSGYTFTQPVNFVTINSSNVTAVNFTASAGTLSITGTITSGGVGLSGVTVFLTGAGTASVTTNASGVYTITGLINGSYSLTPVLAGYAFSPLSKPVTLAGANATAQDFTATAVSFGISGNITSGGVALPGVSVALTGASTGSVITDAAGNYSFSGLANGSYTVTPTKAGYTFTPANRAVTIAGANSTAQNFTAAANNYTLTGTVTKGGAALSGVTMTLSGAATATTTTNASGVYSFTVVSGSYTVTPSLAGNTFAPLSASVTVSGANVSAVNFTATTNAGTTYSLSGSVTKGGAAFPGVTITLSGAASATTTTDAAGNYTFTGLLNGSYTVTPSLAGNSFTPANRAVTIAGANSTAQNFTATALTYSISGTVTSGGVGLSGVTMTLSGGSSATATTNASGAYTFTGLVNGNYSITPSKAGYAFTPASGAATILGANSSAINFTATQTAFNISGTVTLNGAALPGVVISITGGATASAITDAAGSYTVSGLTNGTYTVTPTLAGYSFAPVNRSVTISSANSTAQNFTATALTYTITGSVTLNGAAQSGVTMTLSGTSNATVTTDAAGAYTFTGLVNGNYQVTPSKAGYTYTPTNAAAAISGANVTGVNFTAAAITYTMSGTVVSGAAGLPGVSMALTGAATANVTTNASGAYSFAGLANGTYTVTPTLAGYKFTPVSAPVTVNGANISAVNFTATPVFTITGTITSGGVGLANVSVALTGAATATVTTNASGVYTFTNVVNGNYTVTPTHALYNFTPANRAVTVSGANQTAQNFTAALKTYSITGTITFGGAALGNVSVSLSGASTAVVTTNSSGVYTFTGLANGSYTVTPALAGYNFTPVNRAVTINNANSTAQNFTAATATTYYITGTVTVNGVAMSGVTVNLTGASTATTTTAANGSYIFNGLSNGSYTVTPTKTGVTFNPASTAVTVNGANVQLINFAAVTYSISGTVTLSGVGQSGVTVALTGASSTTATTNASGAYTFVGLLNGAYTVTPSLAGFTYTPANRAVTIAGANSTAQNFTASPVTYSISGTITAGGVGLSGVSVALSGTATATATTNASGAYTFTGLSNGAYTVTPTIAGYAIAPVSANATIASANITGINFTATLVSYSISGTITLNGNPQSGVTVALTGASTGSATTNASGVYTFTGLANGSYTVTPSLAGYVYTPVNRAVTVAGANVTAQNFVANPATYSISGTVTSGGVGVAGVAVNLTGAATASATTAADGSYTFPGLLNGSYTVTPNKAGFTMNPTSTNVTINNASVTGINFTAAVITYTLSGNVTSGVTGLQGVTITLSGASTATASTDVNGNYTISGLPHGGSVAITPTLAGYIFTPISASASNITANVNNVNFNATANANPTYSVSGTISFNGVGLPGVTVNLGGGANASAITNASGNYTISGLLAGSYTVTPQAPDFSFGPNSSNVTITAANITGVNFTATGIYSLSGNINSFNGGPPSGVTVTLSGPVNTSVVANGNFNFVGLPNGTYTVTPSLPVGTKAMFYPASQTVVINNLNANVQFGSNVFYDISGAISYGGVKTGRIYVTVDWFGGGGGSGVAGTSIAAAGAYTVRGVQPGIFIVCAWMDNIGAGVRNASNPSGCTVGTGTGITVQNANVPGINIVMTDPTLPATQQAAPLNVKASPGDSGALVFWDTLTDANGVELAQSYNLYWHTAANVSPSTFTGKISGIPARNDGHSFANGLTNGTQYYFAVTGVVNGIETLTSTAFGPLTIGTPAGGNTVSGTVTFGITPTGPLVVGVYAQGTGGGKGPGALYFTKIASPVSPQAYTVPGVPSGSGYGIFAFIDMNSNGRIDAADFKYGMNGNQALIDITGNITGQNFAFVVQNSDVAVTTDHFKNQGVVSSDSYQVNVRITDNTKMVVAAALTAGANLPVPLDFPKSQWQDMSRWFGLGGLRPNVGDSYTLNIVYSDGTNENKTVLVTSVLDSCATPVSPIGAVPGQTTPTFTWTAPVNPPVSYTYYLWVGQNNGGSVWNPNNSFPGTQLSVLYNADSTASQPALTSGVAYNWSISVRDVPGNSCSTNVSFTP